MDQSTYKIEMSSNTATTNKKNKRSKTGCQQCKANKKKCDEQKPFCSLCTKRGLPTCDYNVPITLRITTATNMSTKSKKVQKVKRNNKELSAETPSLQFAAVTSEKLNISDFKSTDDENCHTLVPVISQARTFQTYLPFNISFQNQKILNFYETFTSSFLTPGFHKDINKQNPFKKFIPKSAHTDQNIMRLILLFSRIHMKSLGIDYNVVDEKLIDLDIDGDIFDMPNYENNVKISEGDIVFLKHLPSQKLSEYGDMSNYTLIQMVLLSLHTFFPNISPINWRQCIKNAKEGIMNTTANSEMFAFLSHWLCYQELMSSLTTSNLKLIQNNDFDYDFDVEMSLDADHNINLSTSMEFHAFDFSNLEIDEFSGMDRQTLKYISESVKLLQRFSNDYMRSKVQLETMELIISMEKFFFISDISRQQAPIEDQYLITTNKIFGKITVYMLKRRVLEMNINSESIRQMLLDIIALIGTLPQNTSYSSCVFFAMFISGCDLITYDYLIDKRHIILNHLNSLHKNVGMSSCHRVTDCMKQCWKTGKPWWEVFNEHNIDMIFTI